ncbi:MAG: carbohydrate binding domain-containing protein, partial [Actinomycetes bacterium]
PPAYGSINGTTFETFPKSSTTTAEWRRNVVGPQPATSGPYLDWSKNARTTNLTTIMTYGAPNDYQLMRFGLCTTLLGNGFFSYEESDQNHNSTGRWYDEFDNAGAGKGYLGSPLGEARSAVPTLTSQDSIGGSGAFSDAGALNGWTLYSGSGSASTKALDNSTAKIQVTQSTGLLNGTQFIRANVPVKAGTAYTLSFRARADVPLTIQAVMGQAVSPWATHLTTDPIPLTTEWRTYELPVTSAGTDAAAQLNFTLGATVGTIWLDDIKLQPGDRNVYRRDYQGGVALVNATEAAVTVNLGETLRKIKGTQAPSVNDGSLVTAVTIPARDGLVLLRPAVVVPPDTTPPSTTISGVPSGWAKSDVTFSLAASDAGSPTGISTYYGVNTLALTYYTGPVTLSTSGTTTVSYYSVDASGNVGATQSAVVRIDKVAPTIAGATTTSPNGVGWFRAPVTIHFTASDTLSGIAAVSPDVTIASQGLSQPIVGSATDVAGNSASTSVSNIKIDSTPPSTTDDHVATYTASAAVRLVPTDATSGVGSTTWTLDGTAGSGTTVTTNVLGSHTLTYRSTDVAGNTEAVRTVAFTVTATDQVPPATTMSSLPSTWSPTDVTFSLSALDAGTPNGISTFCGIEGQTLAPYAGPST